MVFLQDEHNEIDTRIVMVVYVIFRGISKEEEAKKHYSLTLIILADIHQSTSLCKNGSPFFRGCNIFLHWWMTGHLCKKDDTQQQELFKTTQMIPLDNYELYLIIRMFPIHTTRDSWAKVFYDLR